MKAVLKATPAQVEIIEDKTPIKVVTCGRRWGKTTLMALALARTAFAFPGSKSMYIANDYALSLDLFRTMKRARGFMRFVKSSPAQFPPRMELKNGSEIQFRSGDRPELILGGGRKLICQDEAARGKRDLYQEKLLPMIADTDGQIILGSTYNGRNWYYDLSKEGRKGAEDIRTWVYPSRTGLKFQGARGKRRLERLRKRFPESVWLQEFECQPLASKDAVFRFVERIVGGRLEPTAIPGHNYVLGLDLGRVKDPTGAVVLDLNTDTVAHAESFPLMMEHAEQAQRAKRLAQAYNDADVIVDSTGGAAGGKEESYVKFYRDVIDGLREITWTRTMKMNLVNQTALDIERKKVYIPKEATELVAQTKLYQYRFGANAIMPTYGAPSGEHDDEISGLMMCLWARERGWVSASAGRRWRGLT